MRPMVTAEMRAEREDDAAEGLDGRHLMTSFGGCVLITLSPS